MNVNNPYISIVIPCFNYGCFLNEAIDSALQQTYKNCSITVIDDGSTDNTASIAETYANKIRYVYTKNIGVYAARNLSLEYIEGDFYLNLDADDRLAPNFIEKAVALFCAGNNEKLAFVYPQYRAFGCSNHVSNFPEYDLQKLKIRNFIVMSSLIRLDLLRKFRFDPAFNNGCGDYDLYLSLAESGYKGKLLNEPLLHYRIHPKSITSGVRRRYDQLVIMRRLIEKHKGLYNSVEKKRALAEAANRILVAICANRHQNTSLLNRFRDLYWFLRINPIHPEFLSQLLYTFSPAKFMENK